MADEQGLNVADGFFARGELGETVKAQLVNVGVATRRLPPQDSAPAGAEPGDLAVQDGGNWDPVSNSGNAAVIVYDGSSWNLVADIGSDLS